MLSVWQPARSLVHFSVQNGLSSAAYPESVVGEGRKTPKQIYRSIYLDMDMFRDLPNYSFINIQPPGSVLAVRCPKRRKYIKKAVHHNVLILLIVETNIFLGKGRSLTGFLTFMGQWKICNEKSKS